MGSVAADGAVCQLHVAIVLNGACSCTNSVNRIILTYSTFFKHCITDRTCIPEAGAARICCVFTDDTIGKVKFSCIPYAAIRVMCLVHRDSTFIQNMKGTCIIDSPTTQKK